VKKGDVAGETTEKKDRHEEKEEEE